MFLIDKKRDVRNLSGTPVSEGELCFISFGLVATGRKEQKCPERIGVPSDSDDVLAKHTIRLSKHGTPAKVPAI